MDRKLLLLGGAAVVGLVILSGRKASASAPPALPSPPLKLVPRADVTVPAPRKVELQAPASDQAAANAAAAAAASASAPPMSSPMASPAASSLTSTSSPAAPSSVSQTPSIPDGYDPTTARKGARSVANNLARGIANYSRPLLKQWQKQAGLKPDGIYGGATRGALLHYGAKDPPRPFFPPTNTIPYVPPA